MRYNWKQLNNLQVGTFSEYFVKMEMTMYGLQVYSTEVDDQGIDFVVRFKSGPFYLIQVKSTRGMNYIYMQKDKFELSSNTYLALVILDEGKEPRLFLIPSEAWKQPNKLFVGRDYEGKKSKPEWGVNLSQVNMKFLEQYSFDVMIEKLKEKRDS